MPEKQNTPKGVQSLGGVIRVVNVFPALPIGFNRWARVGVICSMGTGVPHVAHEF